jgi:dUTP pyrophosphatase
VAPPEDLGTGHLGSEHVGTVDIAVTRLDRGLPLPSYAHPGDAGADLRTTVDVLLEPGERALVPTGVAIALPEGYVALVHPRSGLAARHGVGIVNAPGTVDAGYRGEVSVLLVNLDRSTPVQLRRGDRIAQLVVQRVERARFREVDRLPGSSRGEGGYGSTGGFAGTADAVTSGPDTTEETQ